MKTKQLKFLAVASVLALSLGFTGCSNDDADPIGPSVPETGSLMISFKASELATKAVNKTATETEKSLKTVHAFVYKQSGALEKVAAFSASDFTPSGDSYTLKSGNEIEGLEVGTKTVALGVNLPEGIVTKIQSAASAGMTTAYDATVAELSNETKGYVMFSNTKTTSIVSGGTTVSDPFSVDRVVAKTSVKTKENISMEVAGGKITGITYAVQNINTQFYPVAPSTFNKAAINPALPTAFKPVENVPSGDVDDTNHSYMTEYKPTLPLVADSYPTYVRIRCAFVPTQYIIDDAGTTSNAEYTGGEFWTLPLKDGTVAYFVAESIAQQYFAANSSLINNPEGKEYDELVGVYADGNVDYGVFLHKTANKFDVVRNNYYIITITGINGLGEPSETPQIDPKEKGSLVSFDLIINDWEGVESDDEQIS